MLVLFFFYNLLLSFFFFFFFFFNDTATTEIYTLSLHDALPISTMTPLSYATYVRAGNSFVSANLSNKIALGMEVLADVRRQLEPLISKTSDPSADDIQTAAACAMLHSFYTEIEKIFTLIAREIDQSMPETPNWHRELLVQMSSPAT